MPLLRLCVLFGVAISLASGSTSCAQATNLPSVLIQIANSFSTRTQAVGSVQLTGTAYWYAGSLRDSGSATLTASSTGAATMRLELAEKGAWTESQSAEVEGMTCQWIGSDGVVHAGSLMNCDRPAVWFLPLLSLQPTTVPSGVGVIDLGNGSFESGIYRHLQFGMAFSNTPVGLATDATTSSLMDLGIDPSSLLPAVLSYQVHPDDGEPNLAHFVIRYSNYQATDGVEIPRTIRRFVNGSLQLEIDVASAQIN